MNNRIFEKSVELEEYIFSGAWLLFLVITMPVWFLPMCIIRLSAKIGSATIE